MVFVRHPIQWAAVIAVLVALLACGKVEQFEKASQPNCLSVAGRTEPVCYVDVNGFAIFEGDIVLGKTADIQALADDSIRRSTVLGGVLANNFWPTSTIPYTVDPLLPNPSRVTNAIAHYQQFTGVKWVPRTTEEDYVNFTTEPGGICLSYVGRVGGKQDLMVAEGCETPELMHEMGHALGFFHEQSRQDRDAYINVHLENVLPGYEAQFNKNDPSTSQDYGPYDILSIMHYPYYAFSKNGQPTITRKDNSITDLGRKLALSAGDISTIAHFYPGGPGSIGCQFTVETAPSIPINGNGVPLARSSEAVFRVTMSIPGGYKNAFAPQFQISSGEPVNDREFILRGTFGDQGVYDVTVEVQAGDQVGSCTKQVQVFPMVVAPLACAVNKPAAVNIPVNASNVPVGRSAEAAFVINGNKAAGLAGVNGLGGFVLSGAEQAGPTMVTARGTFNKVGTFKVNFVMGAGVERATCSTSVVVKPVKVPPLKCNIAGSAQVFLPVNANNVPIGPSTEASFNIVGNKPITLKKAVGTGNMSVTFTQQVGPQSVALRSIFRKVGTQTATFTVQSGAAVAQCKKSVIVRARKSTN